MRGRFGRGYGALLLTFLVSAVARAESAPTAGDISDLDLDALLNTYVSTATKREIRSSESPVSVTTLSSADIDGLGNFSLCDALQYVQGMSCRRGAMRKSAASSRGLGFNFLSNRILLLKDGRPETDPWTGIFYPDETTPLSNVKQIEVLRGPGSSLYGSNAFSGVVNVITRRPSDVIAEGRNFGGDVRVLGGQDNTVRAQGTLAAKAGEFGALVSYYGLRSDGPQLLNDPSRGIVDENEWSRVQQVSGRGTWKGLTLDLGYTTSQLGRPGGNHFTTVGNCGRCHYTPNDSETVETFTASLNAKEQVTERLELFADVYANFKHREVSLFNPLRDEGQPTIGRRRRLGAEARAVFVEERFTVTGGADVKLDAINTGNVLEGIPLDALGGTTLGAFADVELRPFDRWVAFVGLRYDHPLLSSAVWQNPSAHLSPRATLLHHLREDLTLSARYGHSFRAPSFAELAISQQMYGATLIGDPRLVAESLDSYELAADWWTFDRRVKLNATGFYEHGRNLVGQRFLLGSISQFANQGDAHIFGGEAEASVAVPSLGSRLDFGYQFLRARSVDGSGGPERALDYAPEHRVFARGHIARADGFFVDVYGVYVAARQDPGFVTDASGNVSGNVTLPEYVTASVRAGLEVSEGLKVSLLASNLFNTRYQESLGFPAPGLSVFGQVEYAFPTEVK